MSAPGSGTRAAPVTVDGARGEGGGQVIRTSLSLSVVTGRAFRVERVRANRSPGGLRPQHLMAVHAAAEVCGAQVIGAEVGSTGFAFAPGAVRAGDYEFDIGTAGSTTLVLQTLLMPLLLADGPSTVAIVGGTHNQHAPPVEFVAESFLPLVRRMGGSIDFRVRRYGSYPRGGGRIEVAIKPIADAVRLEIIDRVEPVVSRARALVVRLPDSIAERELTVLGSELNLASEQLELVSSSNGGGPGNAVLVSIDAGSVVETVSSIGEQGLSAEDVARAAVRDTQEFVAHGVPVGEHLADQLLLPLVLTAGGAYLTGPPTLHLTTNVHTISLFVDTHIAALPQPGGAVLIEVGTSDQARSARRSA